MEVETRVRSGWGHGNFHRCTRTRTRTRTRTLSPTCIRYTNGPLPLRSSSRCTALFWAPASSSSPSFSSWDATGLRRLLPATCAARESGGEAPADFIFPAMSSPKHASRRRATRSTPFHFYRREADGINRGRETARAYTYSPQRLPGQPHPHATPDTARAVGPSGAGREHERGLEGELFPNEETRGERFRFPKSCNQ